MITDTIVFDGLGTNASDTQGLAQSRQLTIRANVVGSPPPPPPPPPPPSVPVPSTLWLALTAMFLGWVVRRPAPRPEAAPDLAQCAGCSSGL